MKHPDCPGSAKPLPDNQKIDCRGGASGDAGGSGTMTTMPFRQHKETTVDKFPSKYFLWPDGLDYLREPLLRAVLQHMVQRMMADRQRTTRETVTQ